MNEYVTDTHALLWHLYAPKRVGPAAREALAGLIDHYTFISSVSVYAEFSLTASEARFTWADEDFLAEREIGPWIQLPLWLPEESNGIFEVRNDKATAAGLALRPLADTIGDTLAWDRSRTSRSTWKTGLDPQLESELLRDYAARAASA